MKSGPAKVTWNSGNFYAREDFAVRHAPTLAEVPSSLHGVVDTVPTDLIITIPMRLFGAWEELDKLFPTTFKTPTIGSRVFGTTDLPLVIHATNQDRRTYHNARLTQMPNLFLGVNASMFAADVVFTALIKNSANPEDANSYYTDDTAAYADTGFAKTNYKQQRYAAAWSGVTGFTAFQFKEGVNVEHNLRLAPDRCDGVGTVDMIIEDFSARVRGIPLEPTIAQIEAAMKLQGSGGGLGRLMGAASANLAVTGSGVSVTLNSATMIETGLVFGARPYRIGETIWQTTVGLTAGVAAARVAIS